MTINAEIPYIQLRSHSKILIKNRGPTKGEIMGPLAKIRAYERKSASIDFEGLLDSPSHPDKINLGVVGV